MKVGILGAGMIVHDMLSFIHEIDGIELTAICALPTEKAKIEDLSKKHGISYTYTDYNEMLKNDEVEVIYVAVNNHLHYEMCMKALEAKKHVICEKPFTSHVKELKKLYEYAKANNLLLLEAISTQYLPNVEKIKELLPEIGNVKIVSANYSQYSSRYDAFKEGNILPAFDYTKSGGALMDLNIYNIHFMVSLFGEPSSVEYQANVEKNIDTSGIITLDYDKFKAVLIGAKDCKAPILTSIQGDQGCIIIDTPANNVSSFKLLKNDKTEYEFNEQQGKHRMYFEFVQFVKIFENKDYKKAEDMMKKSLLAMNIATSARESAGVKFISDDAAVLL